jgi:hypothetical protein
MNGKHINVIVAAVGVVSGAITIGLFLTDHLKTALVVGGALGVGWCFWVTLSIVSLLKRVHERHLGPDPVGMPEPKFKLCMGEARRIDSKERKSHIPSDILRWKAGTLLFWVDLHDELAHSEGNRYIFSYTTNVLNDSGHPDGFYLQHRGGTTHWYFLFYHDPAEAKDNRVVFDNSPDTLGIKLVAIRWCEREGFCDFTIDAGESFHKRRTLHSWTSWPKASGEDIHIGGWLDSWDGGLSRTMFTGIRVYEQVLREDELLTLYRAEKEEVLLLLGPKA